MSAAITVAPARASARLSSAPRPRAAPVTMAILPATAMSWPRFRSSPPNRVTAIPADGGRVHRRVTAVLSGGELDQLNHAGQRREGVYVGDPRPGRYPVRESDLEPLAGVVRHRGVDVSDRDPPVMETVSRGFDPLSEHRR